MKKTFGPKVYGIFELVRTQLGFTDLMSTGIWIFSACVVSVVALVRTPLFTQAGMATFAPPGEEFALRPVRPSFLAHLALIIPWCFLGVFQFVPSVRKSLSFTYHRVAGRVFLLLSLGVAASGLSMASRAFGGSFVSQVGMAVLFFSFLLSIAFGYLAVRSKDIPSHRDWMIRLFSYGTSVITLRLFMFIGLRIAAALRLWTATQCDVILNLLGHSQTTTAFPACLSTSGSGSIDPAAVVAIQASFASSANLMAALQIGYDSSILLALLVHATLAELWIRRRYYSRREDALVDDSGVEHQPSLPLHQLSLESSDACDVNTTGE